MSAPADNRILGFSAKWAKRLLIVSLIANFLVIGAVIGLGMRTDDRKRGKGVISEIAEVVGEDRRPLVREKLRERSRGWREARKSRSAEWLSIAELLEGDGFSAEALGLLLKTQDETRAAIKSGNRDALVEALAILTPEERRAYAKRIRAHVEERDKRLK